MIPLAENQQSLKLLWTETVYIIQDVLTSVGESYF